MASAANATVYLNGTHGTSRTRASAILESNQFKASDDGRAGAGVYFWSFQDDVFFAQRLAENWWRLAVTPKFNSYKGDADKSLAVLKAKIEAPTDEYFDANSEGFLNLLIKTAEKRQIESSKDEIELLRLYLIKEIENERAAQYGVIKLDVDVPGLTKGEKTPAPYVSWLKRAPCIVVRKHAMGLIKDIELVGE